MSAATQVEKRVARALLPDTRQAGGDTIRGSQVGTTRALSWVMSTAGVFACTTLFILFVPNLWHWMIFPTGVAGVLVGVDVIDWFRGRLDVLAPRAVVAIFGLHLCYLGPLLHVTWDYWPKYVPPAHDWRTSLGLLAIVNVFGLVLYRMVLAVREAPTPFGVRALDMKRFKTLGGAAIAIGLIALIVVIVQFGGPVGYLRVLTGRREALAGSGWLLLIAESWPMLVFALVLVSRRTWFRTHLVGLILAVGAFVLVQFVTGGLRGSRANTVWPTLIAIGLVHLVIRPVRKRVLIAAALVLVAFMYVYGFYKSIGTEVLDLADQQTTTSALARQTGRTLPLLLLEDFGRAGTQSIVIDRLDHGGGLAWGETYVGDLVKLTPDSLVKNSLVDKTSAGTDLLYVPGAYDAGLRSSRIFGLVGEGMLNFGLIGGVLVFLPFAVFIRWADRLWRGAVNGMSLPAKLLAPSLTTVCVLALGSDFDNVLRLLYAQVLPLAAVVYLAGVGRSMSQRVHGR